MYKAQQEIEERKRQLGLATPAPSITGAAAPAPTVAKNVALRPQEAQMFIQASMNKKSRVDELKVRFQVFDLAQGVLSVSVPGKTSESNFNNQLPSETECTCNGSAT